MSFHTWGLWQICASFHAFGGPRRSLFWRNRRMRHIFSTIGKVFVTLPKILGRLGWSAKAEIVFASVYLSLLFPYPLLFCLWVIYLTITDFDTSMARDETLSKASTMDWIFLKSIHIFSGARCLGSKFGSTGSCGIFWWGLCTTIASVPSTRWTIIFFASIAFSGAKHWLEESGCFCLEKIHCTKTFASGYGEWRQ